jgi:hypothetical protein
MTSKLQKKPKLGLPNWRITLPLAQASPRWRTHQDGHALQGTSDGLREVQDAWGRQPALAHARPRGWSASGRPGRRAMVRVLMTGAKRLVERR